MLRRRVTLRVYLVLLCLVYFTMLYVFHGRLQLEMNQNLSHSVATKLLTTKRKSLLKDDTDKRADIKRHVLETRNDESGVPEKHSSLTHTKNKNNNTNKLVNNLSNMSNKGKSSVDKNCFVPSNIPNRTFQALDPSTFVYSAYFDERYMKRIVRIMATLHMDKNNRVISFFCTFLGDGKTFRVKASVYELCENHGKLFGGYILSCDVPSSAITVCSVNVSMEATPKHFQFRTPNSNTVTLAVTQLKHRLPEIRTDTVNGTGIPVTRNITTPHVDVPYNFSICVPPLFGKIDTIKFVEFIELHRILGFQHFIFYLANIETPDIITILDYYRARNVVTLIQWNLPSVTRKGKIWYNGQLNAHNDCLYRAMTITKYLAIIDIDEFIVPHNGQATISNSIEKLFTPSVCGLSFISSFYDKKFSKNIDMSKLVTVARTKRSTLFSVIRTKVLVKPERVFEVGIHHISKPAQEGLKVVSVNMSIAFLHHYRSCVPNYGMKCGQYVLDTSLQKHETELAANVVTVMKEGLFTDVQLYS